MNVINVEHLARSRGIELVQIHEPDPPAGPGRRHRRHPRRRRRTANRHRILGTVYADGLPRVLRIDGFAMDMIPEGHMVLIVNKDQPGVIGTVGTQLRRRQASTSPTWSSAARSTRTARHGADGDQDRQRPAGGAAQPPAGAAEYSEGEAGGAAGAGA